jgi:hypothetical protein
MAPAAAVLWRNLTRQLQQVSTAGNIDASNRIYRKVHRALEHIQQLPAASNADWEALVIKKKVR